jgi:hypothetical protein
MFKIGIGVTAVALVTVMVLVATHHSPPGSYTPPLYISIYEPNKPYDGSYDTGPSDRKGCKQP